jgi:hypothetical protein
MNEAQMRPAGFRFRQNESDDRIERAPLRIALGIAAAPAIAEIAVGLGGQDLAGDIASLRISPFEAEAVAGHGANVIRHEPGCDDFGDRQRAPNLLGRLVELAFDDDGSVGWLGGGIIVH